MAGRAAATCGQPGWVKWRPRRPERFISIEWVMRKKRLIPVLLLILLSGCGTGLQQQWWDFTSYYNTFYNARTAFSEGVKLNQAEMEPINRDRLLRVHPRPSTGGEREFAIAIEKSSTLLQRHPRSSYLDDALELIGISQFYLGDFLSARETFRELYRMTPDPEKRQSAVIWEGKTHLELNLFQEGAGIMEEEIGRLEWNPVMRAEALTVLAQLEAFRGEYDAAAMRMANALDGLKPGKTRTRAWFFYGQIMERIGDHDQAAHAFEQIRTMRPEPELDFNARLMEIEILRKRGESGLALQELQAMQRHDKWSARRSELLYEMARVRFEEDPEEAERLLWEALEPRDRGSVDPPVEARIWYLMGDLYRVHQGEYGRAANYYQAAAMTGAQPEQLPEGWDAEKLAGTYGELAHLQLVAEWLEQLLELADLTDEERDRRLQELRQEYLTMQENRAMPEVQGDAGARQIGGYDPGMGLMESSSRPDRASGRARGREAGNREAGAWEAARMGEEIRRFREIWGARPLTDNWRIAGGGGVNGGVAGAGVSGNVAGGVAGGGGWTGSGVVNMGGAGVGMQRSWAASGYYNDLGSDLILRPPTLEELPLEEAQQDSIRLLASQYRYRLGLHYLIALEMPDSARFHLIRVVEEGPEQAPRDLALYALAEIAMSEGDVPTGRRLAAELRRRWPDSVAARRVVELGWVDL